MGRGAKSGIFRRGERQLHPQHQQHLQHHYNTRSQQRRQTDALHADLERILAVPYAVRDPHVDSLRSTCIALSHQLVLLRLQLEQLQSDHLELQLLALPLLFGRDPSSSSNGPFSFEPEQSVPRTRAMAAMNTPVLDNFLASVAELVRDRDGPKLQDYLQIEPPLPEIYHTMVDELKSHYPAGPQGDAELLKRCETLVPRARAGSPWTPFPVFMKLYLTFLRDVNVENLLETYNLLKGLLK